MEVIKPFKKNIRVKITSADITGFLKAATGHNLILQDIVSDDDLTIQVTITGAEYKKLTKIAQKRGDHCRPVRKWGVGWSFSRIKNRWLLIVGILFFVALTVFVPSRLFFFDVKGNNTVPKRWILEKAEQSGLQFGCLRSGVKSERIKNNLLLQIPELDWVGVTTAGCVATIEVKEKPAVEHTQMSRFAVGHIVAACDGVVEQMTVTNGMALCKPGQAVSRGQILISGFQDCGIIIKATEAEGEVFAKTFHPLQMVTPVLTDVRREKIYSERKYFIQIGKKLINFAKDSGISPYGCVKMYNRKYLTLPGGFELPVALICEEQIYYETECIDTPLTCEWLDEAAKQYVLSQMSAGQILTAHTQTAENENLYTIIGAYACREQIGENRIEEILKTDGKDS